MAGLIDMFWRTLSTFFLGAPRFVLGAFVFILDERITHELRKAQAFFPIIIYYIRLMWSFSSGTSTAGRWSCGLIRTYGMITRRSRLSGSTNRDRASATGRSGMVFKA